MSRNILMVNVHFSPDSYGGATVTAENVARLLASDHHWNVLGITTIQRSDMVPYGIVRYRAEGVDVIGINVPSQRLSYVERYDNPVVNTIIQKIIERFQPDVAHFHSIQNLGATFIRHLQEAAVPVLLSIHDCWWLCERQFMVTAAGSYCGQQTIDPRVCHHCVADPAASDRRRAVLLETVTAVTYFLFPSKSHMELYVSNGIPADKCIMSPNGVQLPGEGYKKTRPDKGIGVRFGYVGGPGPAKGYHLILQAFNQLEESDYELVVVDAAQNIGGSWQNADWRIPGNLRFEPAYTTNRMDDFFSSIDVLLFPSQCRESFGLTVREALARHVWPIVTDAGGLAEDCVDGMNSTVIPMDGSVGRLKDAIHDCLHRDWSDYVNPYARQIVSFEAQASQISKLLEQQLASGRARYIDRKDPACRLEVESELGGAG